METFVSLTYAITGAAILLFLKPALADRDNPENRAFVVFIIAVALYAFFDATNLLITGFGLSLFLQKATITAGILIGISWLLFAVVFSEDYTLNREYTIALGLYVVVTVLGTWFNVGNMIIGPGAIILETLFWPDPQLGFFILLGGAYLQILLGTGVFATEALKAASIRRKQAMMLTLAILPAVLGSFANAYVLSTDFPTVDFTIYGFAISSGVFAAAMYSGRFLDIKPIARQTVVNEMDEAVITVDEDNRVVDCNTSAKELCNVTDQEIGLSVAAFFDSTDIEIDALLKATGQADTVVETERNGEAKYYRLSVTAINESPTRGRIIIIRDITAQKAREKQLKQQKTQLERQNERLDEFAGVVSHDLKGPITVAGSYVNIARQKDDPEDEITEIEAALGRAENLIEDLLDVARRPQEFDHEPVRLDRLAHQAWATVLTSDQSLVVETDAIVTADPSHLQRLFENLFRNSIEYGGSDVTVRVGTTADGFYIADDGVGIPANKRENVFDIGVTEDPDGTGYGLAIVRNIVDGHGWSIEITTSESGGARFDITNVSFDESAQLTTQEDSDSVME
jgi:PAS domain S-box-containing protein